MVNTFIRDSAAATLPQPPGPLCIPILEKPPAICTASNWPKRAQELVERGTLPSAISNNRD